MQRLVAALAAADARAAAAAPVTPEPEPVFAGPDAVLVNAVRQNDIAAARAALKNGADPNAGQGRPLRIAAEATNFELMAELAIRGAEVSQTVEALKAEKKMLESRVPQLQPDDPHIRAALNDMVRAINPHAVRGANDRELATLLAKMRLQRGDLRSMPPQDAKRCQQNTSTIKTLEEWQARFLREISPLDILRQQQKILDELDDLKRELMPRRLDKPKFSAPKPRNG